MPVYFYSDEFDIDRIAAVEKKIRTAIPDLVRVKQIAEIAQHSPDARNAAYLLVASFDSDGAHLARLVDAASRHNANVILISDEISATSYKRLVRAGVTDWVSANAAPQEILEVVSRRRGEAAPRADGRRPLVACFVPCAGGVGNTTLAVEAATFLKTDKATSSRNICLVDLDFQTSHACDYLDIEPRLQIEEISNNPERLDEQLMDIYVSRHSCGLHVLAAPRTKFNVCELNLSALDALFNMMATRYDLILIDFPATWFAWSSQIISGSDGIVVTGLNSIPGLRQLVETIAVIRDTRHPSAQLAVAINRCERRTFGTIARRHHVEKVLGREQIFYVRDEPMAVEAVNTGMPMALSHAARKTSAEIASIARFCGELKSIRDAAPQLSQRK